MKKLFSINVFVLLGALGAGANATASVTVESFEIEGLISPASPKALASALEEKLSVKVIDVNLKNTDSGWPVLRVEFDTGQVSREDIERAVSAIEDPAGHNYQVHKGPPTMNAAYSEEEKEAMAALAPTPFEIPTMTNPVDASEESIGHGKQMFEHYCATCHGLNGGGHGPAAHGITTFPRQLWAWNNADSSADGYLFSFITNGRNEMPPWGVILSENERWDIINYIKTLEEPE